MFSGLKRDRDLEWYLVRIGAIHGMKVVVISLDLAYGSQNDLYDMNVVKRLVLKGKERFWSGAHNGSPCSTWSKVKSQPGGPPPLRSRTYPWGLPHNSTTQQKHTDIHSELWKNSMNVLMVAVLHGSLGTNEHPEDPGRHPFPSTWSLRKMKHIEQRCGFRRVVFPQCLWGLLRRKGTCLSGNVEDLETFDKHGNGRCYHEFHPSLKGKDSLGHFRTRMAQTYPAEMRERLAQCYVNS